MAIENPSEGFPAVAYKIGELDPMYEQGRRFRLDQLDGGQYYFRDRAEMNEFVRIHDFKYIKEEDMIQMREAYDNPMA